jgi:hypothetical protein
VSIQGICAREDLLALRNIHDSFVVYMANSCSNNLCWTTRWLVAIAPQTRSRIPPWCSTISNDVTNLTTIVVCVGHYTDIPWRWVQHGRWGYHSSRHDALMLQWTYDQLTMMLIWWVVMWSTHHPILVRSTTRWGCHNLLLAFLMSMDGIIRNAFIANKFQENPISVECKALLKLGG